jgi:hypothetical protein
MPPTAPPWWNTLVARRRLLQGGGALAGATVWSGCAGPFPPTSCPPPDPAPDPLDAALAATPDGQLDLTGLPYRQDDPRWGGDIMWDREKVLRAAVELNDETPEDAAALIRAFPDGNTIANEGCQLTCLAMALHLLMPDVEEPWTPRLLNQLAHLFYYYTPSGLSLTTLYGDLVSDASVGVVQLALKEEFLPGVERWPRVTASTSPLVRAYRSLPPAKRTQFVVMLKTGTYDDTVASHFCLLHPLDDGGPDDDNVLILDPAQPLDDNGPWRLSDSASWITSDPAIGQAWQDAGIDATQLGGVWVFVRGTEARDRAPLAPLVHAWARVLASGR